MPCGYPCGYGMIEMEARELLLAYLRADTAHALVVSNDRMFISLSGPSMATATYFVPSAL